MPGFQLTSDQLAIIRRSPAGRIFLEGPAGSGKTSTGVERLLALIHAGVPAEIHPGDGSAAHPGRPLRPGGLQP